MSTPEIIAGVAGLLTIIVNIVALGWSIRQTQQQRRDSKEQAEQQNRATENLTRLTSELEAEVQRLSVELDQSIQRLHHALELLNGIHRAMIGEKKIDWNNYAIFALEFEALSMVVKDDLLKQALREFTDIMAPLRERAQREDVLDPSGALFSLRAMYKRIYELLEGETRQLH